MLLGFVSVDGKGSVNGIVILYWCCERVRSAFSHVLDFQKITLTVRGGERTVVHKSQTILHGICRSRRGF